MAAEMDLFGDVCLSVSRASCAILHSKTGRLCVNSITMLPILLLLEHRSLGFGSCLLIPRDAELSTLMTRPTPFFTVLYVVCTWDKHSN